MAGRNRLGFTLVELLVVVVIIAMLVGLLLPAVIGGRERARQAQCSNNQRELGLATQQYETAKHQLPGSINSYASATNLSWVVVLLPHLGREDLWTEWRKPTTTYTYDEKRAQFVPEMPQLICPSDSPTEKEGALSYVASCGIQDRGIEVPTGSGNWQYETPVYGVFLSRFDPALSPPSCTNWKPIAVSSDRLPDGAQQTLLLSENIQATLWAPPLDPASGISWTGYTSPTACAPNALTPDQREAHVGMVWWQNPGSCSKVNQCRDVEVDANNPDIQYARPSSFHTDGVVVTYCDGHQDFMLDDIDYNVFRRLMAPDDDKAGVPPTP